MTASALYLGLVGLLGGEAAGEAAADNVGSGALLGFGEGVETFECLGADSDALHLSGGHGRTITYPNDLRNVSQWDTVIS